MWPRWWQAEVLLIAHQGVVFDIGGNDAHVVFELTAFFRGGLEEDKLPVYEEDDGCESYVLGGITAIELVFREDPA
jgi:hypothetical protein